MDFMGLEEIFLRFKSKGVIDPQGVVGGVGLMVSEYILVFLNLSL